MQRILSLAAVLACLSVSSSPAMDFGVRVIANAGMFGFGDSMMLSNGASDQAHGYAYLLDAKIGGAFLNYSVSGTGTSIAAHNALANLPLDRKPAVVTMIGFNDILRGGAASYTKIKSNHRAMIAAALLKDVIPASSMRQTGTWNALSSSAGGRALAAGGTGMYTTDAGGAYLDADFFGETLVVGAYTQNAVGGTYQDFAISIDGGAPVTYQSLGQNDEAYPATGHGAMVFKNLGFAKHTVRLSQITGGNYTAVDYVGTLAAPGSTGSVFVGQIPSMVNWMYLATPTILNDANTAIASVVAEFSEWPVVVVPVNDFYTPGAGFTSADGQHPADAGHAQIMSAFWSRMSPSF